MSQLFGSTVAIGTGTDHSNGYSKPTAGGIGLEAAIAAYEMSHQYVHEQGLLQDDTPFYAITGYHDLKGLYVLGRGALNLSVGAWKHLLSRKGPGKATQGLDDSLETAGKLVFDPETKSWTSTGGLIYGQGSQHGNRVKHVLDHLVPNPKKTTHSIFNVDRTKLIGLLDEAWAKKGVPLPNDPGAYIIDMGRVIGTGGETKIKIVVRPGTNQVITAYPFP